MVDSHCHLANEAFAADRDAVIARAEAAGVRHALCMLESTKDAELAEAQALLALWPALRFAVGVHPHESAQFGADSAEAEQSVRQALERTPGVRAIGEIGLDYHYDFAPPFVQQEVFRCQVRLAVDRDLPVIIHTREAAADTLAIIGQEGQGRLKGIFHCFSEGPDLARQAVALGFHVSFAGIVTFANATEVREAAGVVPLDRLLVETDCPYLAPPPHRGKRNEPAWVEHIVEVMARLKGIPVEQLKESLSRVFVDLIQP